MSEYSEFSIYKKNESNEAGSGNIDDQNIKLNVLQAQQLKRDLLTRDIIKEIEYLVTTNLVRVLRPPETKKESSKNEKSCKKQLTGKTPLAKYFFQKYILTFPFLNNTDLPSFLDKLEQFQDELLKSKISTDAERSDTTKRQVIVLRIQKILVLLFNNSTPVKIENLNPACIVKKVIVPNSIRPLIVKEENSNKESMVGTPYLVDVVGVRASKIKGTFKNSIKTNFIVMISKPEERTAIYTLKAFEDFKIFLKKLRRVCPLVDLPSLPSKIKEKPSETNLYREQDRLNLRSLFRRLMGMSEIADRPEVYQFLTENPEELTETDLQDISERKKHTQLLAEDRKKFVVFVAAKATEFKSLWATCKADLFKPNGLEAFEKMLKSTPNIKDLPLHFIGAIEWGRLNFASFLYTFFCTTDDSVRFYQSLISTHKIVPYRALATILRYTNPTGMAKAILDLLLAQPFGTSSLLQRLLTTSLNDQARGTQKEIQSIENKIKDPSLCERIKNYIYHPEKRFEELKEGISNFERLTVIINDPQIEPELTPEAVKRFSDAREWVDLYLEGKSPPVEILDDIPQYPEFLFLENLHNIFVLQNRKRDAEKISELMFQGLTGELMKDILSVFYEPLAQVYKDANIADFVLKISTFVDDLISVIQKVNSGEIEENFECGQVQNFIDLVSRHEQEFYGFIHSIYSSDSNDLFHNLLSWGDSLLSAIREKVINEPLDMQEFVEKNVPGHCISKLKSDLNELEAYHVRRKHRQMRNLQKKLIDAEKDELSELDFTAGLTQNSNFDPNTQNPNERRQSLVDFGFGDLALDDIRDLEETSLEAMQQSQPDFNHSHQSLVNADPSEPMLVWLNDKYSSKQPEVKKFSGLLGSELNAPDRDDASIASVSSEKSDKSCSNDVQDKSLDIEEIPRRISKFTTPKVIAQISQEPYPENIQVLPTLLEPFLGLIARSLKN